MIWASWRSQRTESVIGLALLGALCLLLVPTGLQMAHAYHHDGLAACLSPDTSVTCGQAISSFTSRFESLDNLVAWVTIVPGLLGVLLAAPLVLDLENGTYRLMWTQSITRGRWIATKLGLAVGAAMGVAGALTLLMTWWRTPIAHIQGRMANATFDSNGIVIFGYTLMALGLALAVGVLWRRAVPALVIAFAGYMAARIFVDTWLRQRLTTPDSITWSFSKRPPDVLAHAWVLSQSPSDRFGNHAKLFAGCARPTRDSIKSIDRGCLLHHGAGFTHAIFIPASRFWTLQGIETAMFGGVAVVLIAAAAWWTQRRTA
jgi:hypothetical protein